MAEITDVTVIEGNQTFTKPVVVLDAQTAARAIAAGELEDLVRKALSALELAGRHVVFVEVDE